MNLTDLTPTDIENLEREKLEAVLEKIAPLERILKAVKERAKQLLEKDPEFFEGRWILKDGAKVETIKDATAAVGVLLALEHNDGTKAILPQTLLSAAKFAVTDLREIYRVAFELDDKSAKDGLREALGDVIEERQNAASLKKGK